MHPITTLRRRHVLALAAATASLGVPAFAQAPSAPLRIILPLGAGSGVDTIIRSTQNALSKALGGQAVVIENLPGAGGITGTSVVVRAPADGQTLGVVSNNHVVNPSVFKKMPFDALNDITPISVVGATPLVLVVNPKLPAHNARELQALLKAKPDVYNYASSGKGTIIHLAGAMFVDAAGAEVRHVPYKGVGPMVADLIGGADHRRAGLPRGRCLGLVRRDRPGQAAVGGSQAPACRHRRRLQHARDQGSDGQAGKHHQSLVDPRSRRTVLSQRAGALCQARQESQHHGRMTRSGPQCTARRDLRRRRTRVECCLLYTSPSPRD